MPNIDTDSFRAAFQGNLQQLQDHLRACTAGLSMLTPEVYEEALPKGGVIVAPHYKLDFERVLSFSHMWLARSFFRDAIDCLNDYLDHAFNTCGHVEKVTIRRLDNPPVNLDAELKAFHRKGMPEKFEVLARRFGLRSPLTVNVLSINAVRNCLVHRLGYVRSEDVRQGATLDLQLIRISIVREGVGTGVWKPQHSH